MPIYTGGTFTFAAKQIAYNGTATLVYLLG